MNDPARFDRLGYPFSVRSRRTARIPEGGLGENQSHITLSGYIRVSSCKTRVFDVDDLLLGFVKNILRTNPSPH
jgi:hypothetical protein